VKAICEKYFGTRVFNRYPEVKKRYFWGGKLWTQSYFVGTIGNANEETIRKYVKNQLVELDKHEAKYRQLGLF
jgi:putative transposase